MGVICNLYQTIPTMSQPRTPSKTRISGQLSGSGTVASETPFLKDEFLGRRRQISFPDFCQAFLERDDLDSLDDPAAILYRTSEFQHRLVRCTEIITSSSTETASIYPALADLMNVVVDYAQKCHPVPDAHPLHFTFATSTRSIEGSNSQRKPDLVGVSETGPTQTYNWDTVSVVCEYKIARPRIRSRTPTSNLSDAQPKQAPPASHPTPGPDLQTTELSDAFPLLLYMNESDIQLARYMLEMRSAQPSRAAGYGVQYMKDQASFWYSDADSTVTSAPIPIASSDFVRAIMHLARATAAGIGYLPDFVDDNDRTTTEVVGSRLTIHKVKYHITEVISLARAVHGRCTRVLGAKDPSGTEVAIKFSWQVVTRLSEVDLLETAHSHGVRNVVEVIGCIDLRKLSDGRRARLLGAIQLKLQLEDRCLRVIILPLCMPLYKVIDLKDFLKACISLLDAIHELYTKAKILHRDVSVNNLMVKKANPSEGVLIDLDLGHEIPSYGSQYGPTSLHRTGTLPFMALDLLHGESKYPHFHRHDLESFVYVFFWIIGKYDSGVETSKELFRSWCEGNWTTIRSDKLAFLGFNPPYSDFLPTAFYDNLPIRKLTFRLMKTVSTAHATHTEYLAEQRFFATAPMRDSCADRDYANSPTGSKRQRVATPRVASDVYPEELPDLTYPTIRRLMGEALDGFE
ncbi:unnamed protein product [Rhizoctonia solani]|uniref:Protein kinase domain-containing protein n=1 Tax=Rhizoctonia solani TaxID=456999 RepID=A0A8H3BG02_9AGAM|nr:unnamed protein product [Rhizoctonia solani]